MRGQSPAEFMAFSQLVDPQSIAASSSVNGASVDMQGWGGCLFVLSLGAIDGTQDLQVQDSSDNSSFANISGFAITQVAATGDNKLYVIDVQNPAKRYLRPVVTNGAGATADFQAVIGIRYGRNGLTPVTQHATVGEVVKKQQ